MKTAMIATGSTCSTSAFLLGEDVVEDEAHQERHDAVGRAEEHHADHGADEVRPDVGPQVAEHAAELGAVHGRCPLSVVHCLVVRCPFSVGIGRGTRGPMGLVRCSNPTRCPSVFRRDWPRHVWPMGLVRCSDPNGKRTTDNGLINSHAERTPDDRVITELPVRAPGPRRARRRRARPERARSCSRASDISARRVRTPRTASAIGVRRQPPSGSARERPRGRG